MGWQAYEYDVSGNVSSQTIGFPSSAANGKHLHGYDKAGRLTSWTNPAGTVTGYGYDGSGNRTSAGSVTFEFDARNQLTVEKQGAAVKATFGYTPRGTLKTETRDGVATGSSVDGLGRVVQTGAVSYNYDSLDRLNTRTENANPVAFAYSGIGSDPVSDGTATYYRTPTGRPLALTRNGQTNWVATNRHGDATMLHTAAPESDPIVGTQVFDPWGTPITPVVAPIGYQSNWTDPTSKQPWMNARWYQPKTASFTSRDTLLGGIGGPSVGHNRHTYAANNPISYWDPTGRAATLDDVMGGGDEVSQLIRFATDAAWAGDATGWWDYTVLLAGIFERRGESNSGLQRLSIALGFTQLALRTATLAGTLPDLVVGSYSPGEYAYLVNADGTHPNLVRTAIFVSGMLASLTDSASGKVQADQTSTYIKSFSRLEDERIAFTLAQSCDKVNNPNSNWCRGLEQLSVTTGGSVLAAFGGQYRANGNHDWGRLGDPGYAVEWAFPVDLLSMLLAPGAVALVRKAGTAAAVRLAARGSTPKAIAFATRTTSNCLTHSFRRDTEVVMADGSRKGIAEIEIGDQVLATDPVTGESAIRTVTALWSHEDTELAEVTVIDGDGDLSVVNTTQHHPFWNLSAKAWVDADRLDGGDRLRSNNGQLVTVVSVRSFTGEQWMYDLTVDDLHTYYVAAGDEPVLVHNCIGIPSVTDGNLKNYVDQLYKHANRPGAVGNGTTMDAIPGEIAAGGGRHIQKGEEIASGLRRWLGRNPNASDHDRLVAQSLYNELVGALGYVP